MMALNHIIDWSCKILDFLNISDDILEVAFVLHIVHRTNKFFYLLGLLYDVLEHVLVIACVDWTSEVFNGVHISNQLAVAVLWTINLIYRSLQLLQPIYMLEYFIEMMTIVWNVV